MKISKMWAIFGIVVGLCLSTSAVKAQNTTAGGQDNGGGRGGRGNFDPAQFQKRMMDGVKDRLGFTNDVEWTAVQPLVQKVFDLRAETRTAGMGGFGRGGRGGGTNSFFKTLPEADALQKAIEDKAPAEQVKNALEKYRAARKTSEAKLAAAQADLQKVLSVRQEAQAALMGLVP